MLELLLLEINKSANPKKAELLSRFFKTGPGQYGEGDVFLGITVPVSRKIALKYKNLSFPEISKLLSSKIHEERLIALLILVNQFEHGQENTRKKIFEFYLAHTKFINNWDLVDLSAPNIVGMYLLGKKDRKILTRLARSNNLWERRIAIISTLAFIVKAKEYKDTFEISTILLHDKHDLIHKAVGWMLREVGKRISESVEREFLDLYYQEMPRTMLRYAIERFDSKSRMYYLKKV